MCILERGQRAVVESTSRFAVFSFGGKLEVFFLV
jgi:hypothetical protein